MKNLIIITLLSILYACGTNKTMSEQEINNNKPQSLIKYQTLKKNIINKFFKLETNKHRLGQVTAYKYFPSGKIEKETIFENKNGKLTFKYESGYKYHKNTLVYKYQYSEIPSYKTPELIEYGYTYISDSLSIVIQKIDNQIDSTFIRTNKNPIGNIVKKSEIKKRIYKGRNRIIKSYTTNYFYNKKNELIKKISIENKHRDTSQINYTYSNNILVNESYKKDDYIYEKKYINGLLDTEKTSYGNGGITINRYNYNLQNKEVLKQKFKNRNLIYSYKSFYNKNGLISKYKMINEKNGKSSIWLYKYEKSGRVIYRIDLYTRE